MWWTQNKHALHMAVDNLTLQTLQKHSTEKSTIYSKLYHRNAEKIIYCVCQLTTRIFFFSEIVLETKTHYLTLAWIAILLPMAEWYAYERISQQYDAVQAYTSCSQCFPKSKSCAKQTTYKNT